MLRSALVFCVLIGSSFAAERPADLYVSPQGNDAWSGKLAQPNADRSDGPLATWKRARDEIRNWKQSSKLLAGGLVVEIQAGTYSLTKPLMFSEADSGTATSPILWRAAKNAEVRLIGGAVVADWSLVTDPTILRKLDESVHGKVLQADLKQLGITDFGEVDKNRLELIYNNRPMTVARYPNEGLMEIVDVLGPTPVEIHGIKGKAEGIFAYSGDRPARWIHETDGWLHGYWFWDWSDQRQKISAIDVEKKSITLTPPHHHYGYRKGQWFYAFNMLSELDAPGEWYLDRDSGRIYFYPPDSASDRPQPQAIVSLLPQLIELQQAAHIQFEGFIMEAARNNGLVATDSQQVRIADCIFRNFGETAVYINGGDHNVLANCDLHDIGQGAVVVTGGDRITLTPSEHVVENCNITGYGRWKPMYSAGINLNGVGNQAKHNLIHDAPHMAILFRGNDHLMEFNEIHHVCLESNDAGAIYSGRDWTWRGTVVRFNYFHHVTGFRDRGCLGVYLDDMLCGTNVFGNVFYRVKNASTICGGRDIHIENNIFVECEPALHVDDRALNWAGYHAQEWITEAREKGTVSGIEFDQPPYSTRYPELARMMQENPAAPLGNVIARNIQWRGRWADLGLKEKSVLKIEQNLLDEDPHFVDEEHQNFQLRDDSPAYQLGFQKIPIEQIGLKRE